MDFAFGQRMTRTAHPLLLIPVCLGLPAAIPAQADPPPAAEAVARGFYDAFCRHDAAGVERFYAEDVKFKDAIFSFDDRAGTMGMWRVLLAPEGKAVFRYRLLEATDDVAKVEWIADYEFPATGRPVHNVITATLRVKDGKVTQHTDDFSWRDWSRQAFPLGSLSNFAPVRALLKAGIRGGLAIAARKQQKDAAKAAKTPGLAGSLPTEK